MATTISSAINGPFTLSPANNPLSITGKGTITSTGANIDGIDGASSTAWVITNSGMVSSAGGWGINLTGAGALVNSGVVSGNSGGFMTRGAGTVTNKGMISGTVSSAIYFGAGGSVTNQAGGSILGGQDSVAISGGAGTVINKGTIATSLADGVFLVGGGSVTNQTGGSISGGSDGVVLQSGSVTNQGSISGTGGQSAGVFLQAGGTVANQDGAISGMYYGVFFADGAGTLTNKATITGTSQKGVVLGGGGSLTNQLNGFISGGLEGVLSEGGTGTVTNTGTISGTSQVGVELVAGGSVVNQPGGLISGGLDGVFLDAGGSVTNQAVASISGGEDGIQVSGLAGTITNSGMISGITADGVYFHAGGSVTNQQGGWISGAFDGVFVNGAGTITNNGTISGGAHSVQFGSGAINSRLVINPGGVFTGSADATLATNSTIELAKGNGTISGIGNGNFLGFNTLAVDSGGVWTLSGAGNSIATVLNNGDLIVAGQLTVSSQADPNSTGVFELNTGSNLEVAKAVGIGSRMSFATGSELTVDDYNSFGQNVGMTNYAGTVLQNFGGDGTVDLKNFSSTNIASSFSVSGGILQLQLTNGPQKATLDFQNSGLHGGSFHFSSDGVSGVLITRS